MLSRIKKYLRITRRKTIITKRQDHAISRSLIDPNAQKVLYRLNRAGHTAYLVGGGVRDLLLGRRPKDFDVSTDAHPQQIKALFRNSMLIGRRFRLAHIRFGDMIIETSTFRRQGSHDTAPEESGKHAKHKRTNTFGTPEEDAHMRDFTINGLFYDIRDYTVIDHVGGQKDLQSKLIRCIGDPGKRFPDDPVRMVRAVRFASRLDFTIEKKTLRAIKRHREELQNAAPARMIEEIYRLFGFGTGQEAFRLLEKTKILPVLLPTLSEHLCKTSSTGPNLWDYLQAFDDMQPHAGVQREAAILAVLAFPLFEQRLLQGGDEIKASQHQDLAREVLRDLLENLPAPRRVIDCLARAFDAQRRFNNPKGRFSKKRFVLQGSFPTALFVRELCLRAQGKDTGELTRWHSLRKQFLAEVAKNTAETSQKQTPPDDKPPTKRRRRRRRKPRESVPAHKHE
jgi:poly(A) polymerase